MFCLAIAGGTASGKTTLVKLLKKVTSNTNVVFISTDDYYKPITHLSDTEKDLYNFDHPNSIDFKLLEKHLLLLKNNSPIQKPIYCFKTHNRLAQTTTVLPAPVVVIEGILSISIVAIRNLCNYKIFIDVSENIRLKRRIKRDINERGRTKESVIHQFKNNITVMHSKFVEPYKKYADLIIDGTEKFDTSVNIISALINQQLS